MNNQMIKLWIDDIRPAPAGYYWAKSVHEAKIYCCQHLSPGHVLKIDEFNLDYDAGDYAYMGGDYIELLKWLEKKQHCENWHINGIFKLHSQNAVGISNMRAIIKANGWKEVY